jgi:hypothetical protein
LLPRKKQPQLAAGLSKIGGYFMLAQPLAKAVAGVACARNGQKQSVGKLISCLHTNTPLFIGEARWFRILEVKIVRLAQKL